MLRCKNCTYYAIINLLTQVDAVLPSLFELSWASVRKMAAFWDTHGSFFPHRDPPTQREVFNYLSLTRPLTRRVAAGLLRGHLDSRNAQRKICASWRVQHESHDETSQFKKMQEQALKTKHNELFIENDRDTLHLTQPALVLCRTLWSCK